MQSDLIAYSNSVRPFSGGTDPYTALLKAYQWVQQDPLGAPRNGQPIIILMTDAWASQVPNNISSLATQIKNSGITIVVLAIDEAASVTALQGTNVASPDAYFAATDYATLQDDALTYIYMIRDEICGPGDPYIDLSPEISSFEIFNCTTSPVDTLIYTITNSGNTDFSGTLDVSFYNGNPTVPGTQYLFTESVGSPSITKYVGTFTDTTTNAALQNAGTVYAVVNINGSLAANAVPLSPTLNGATLTETETSTGNNITSAFTRTDGSGCLPYAHIDVQVSNSGQVCDNQLIYYVEVCNIGTADFEMAPETDPVTGLAGITAYPHAHFTWVDAQLV
ncbi:MAG: VWA domain-containing protein, partial [Gammaproteobacteria bacterium]|nr:VWA domain-containing protein [Gammaproteobacteria bacterium]